ncbi:MAG: GAF domain-containing sensor histidine kinase [Deltaproteobacteria bacterium]|nr:GAF domain-containing sensor histidine kinase [Deltaproteobacteria bacterium]
MIYSDRRKLIALYEMIKEGHGHTRLQDFMDSVTRNTTQIMGVKACAIKMLDPERKRLRFASTHGLSEDYLSKDYIELDKSGINRQVIEGSLYSIGRIDEDHYFQFPEDIRKEGINSMLCLPLTADSDTFGVLCVYSEQANYFNEADIGLFSIMTDLIALTMDRITRDIAQSWFMNKATHQMRSPLNTIKSMLHLLDHGYLGALTEQQLEIVTRCTTRLTILQHTVDDLLKLAAKRREVGLPRLTPMNLAATVKTLEPMYRVQATEQGIGLEVQISEDLPSIMAQAAMLDDLLSNLLSNAVKYTPAGGLVTVRLTMAASGWVQLEVSDTGIGIPEVDKPRLFTEFFRAENAKSMVEEGTGLGLVIVREILDRLGGTIQLDSLVGQGTRFTCLFPAAPQPAPAE